MAKITITIEDNIEKGTVRIVADPPVWKMLSKTKFEDLTSAEAYAVLILNKARDESKKADKKIVVPIPRVRLN